MIIEKVIDGIKIKAQSGHSRYPFVVFFMSDWAKWTELVKKNKGLYVLSYGTPDNYGHIELGLQ